MTHRLPTFVFALILLSTAPLAAASAGVSTRTALLLGFPGDHPPAAEGVLVVPGTVIPIVPSLRSTPRQVEREEEQGERLSEVADSLRRTLRLGRIEVSYVTEPVLVVGQRHQLPPPEMTSALRITVELLGASRETATYRVTFADGATPLADSRLAVRRGERAVVGGVGGDDVPYLFLVLEPRSPLRSPSDESPRRIAGDVRPPVRVHDVAPRYPLEARVERIQGVVILQAVIDQEGTVLEVKALKGLPMGLTEAALDAVRQWRFEPARDASGKAVSVYYNLTINFRIDDEAQRP